MKIFITYFKIANYEFKLAYYIGVSLKQSKVII